MHLRHLLIIAVIVAGGAAFFVIARDRAKQRAEQLGCGRYMRSIVWGPECGRMTTATACPRTYSPCQTSWYRQRFLPALETIHASEPQVGTRLLPRKAVLRWLRLACRTEIPTSYSCVARFMAALVLPTAQSSLMANAIASFDT